MKITKVGLFGKFNGSSVAGTITDVKQVIESKGIEVLLGNTTAPEVQGTRLVDSNQPLRDFIDIAVVVGGDGTMLNVARYLSNHQVPTIGVNLGRLGFLTDIAFSELDSSLDSIVNEDFSIEQRTMLHCGVFGADGDNFFGIALNDVVISKGNTGRLIEFTTKVDGNYVSQTRSDGLIVATPTGSTAYSLSAGGPIIFPNLPVLIMAPICPHTLSNRPIVLDESVSIEISKLNVQESPASLALDGVQSYALNGVETLKIGRSKEKLNMIRINGFNYFETLYNKLGWNS